MNGIDKYIKYYNDLVNTRKSRGIDKQGPENNKLYLETHHIKPRCLGGGDSEDNLVLLTAKEHILAHKLLSLIYPQEVGLISALFFLTVESRSGKMLSLKESAQLREEYGKAQKERNRKIRESNVYGGYALSEETRIKMSNSRKGRVVSDETRKKISESEKGKVVSEKTRKKLSDAYYKTKRNTSTGPLTQERKDRISKTLREKGLQQNLNGTVITDGINTYNSTKECAESLRISIKEVIRRLNDKQDNLVVVKYRKFPKPILGPDGETYKSIYDCSKRTGHCKKTIRNWIENYPEKGYKYIKE